MSLLDEIQARDAVRQFGAILDMVANEKMTPAPAGRQCPQCRRRGHVWIDESRQRSERHVCLGCGWQQTYRM